MKLMRTTLASVVAATFFSDGVFLLLLLLTSPVPVRHSQRLFMLNGLTPIKKKPAIKLTIKASVLLAV